MADVKGTAGKDFYTVKKGETYDALEGDDEITFEKGGTAQGSAGNDKITVPDGFSKYDATVWYWSSPKAIYVDLEAGYALDGYGTRDSLINVHNVHGFKQDGDQGYGSAGDDAFWVGPWTWNYQNGKKGLILIDGRGGSDQATLGLYPKNNQGDLVLQVSSDARKVIAYQTNSPGLIYELRNIELFNTWDGDANIHKSYDLLSLIDVTKIGQETLLRNYKGWQSASVGNPVTLTYSFLTQAPATGGEGGTGFSAFTAAQQQTIRDLFYVLQNQTGLAFAEVAGDAGQIRLGVNQQANTRGYSFIPDEFKGDARAGDVWIDQETAAVMKPGQEGYYVLLHELAHALGLQHPLTEADTSGATVLLNSFSTVTNTVMLDVSAATVGGSWPTWFGSFDIQALRYLYGSRAYGSGNDVYSVKDATSNMTIIDDGGMDTLDASTVSVSVNIDLRSGKSSSIGMDTDGTSKFNNIAIAAGSLIENVTGSVYDDVIIGNAQNNLITFMGGNDVVDGQAGIDTIRLWNKSAEFKVAKDTSTGYWNVEAVNNTSGGMELQNTERLIFTDTSWALDTGDSESAGRTAKILGAVFGKEGLANMAFRGIGLFYFDSGMSYEALTLLALDARVGPGASKEAVAQLLQSNVPGLVVNPGAYASTTAMAMYAQESALNKTMVDVVGLSTVGMPYQFWG
jgi:serralysin